MGNWAAPSTAKGHEMWLKVRPYMLSSEIYLPAAKRIEAFFGIISKLKHNYAKILVEKVINL